MKNCKSCGAAIDDESKFCTSCGAPQDVGQYSSQYNNGYQSYGGAAQPGGMQLQKMPISVGGWIGRSLGLSLLALVPIVGPIVYIILLVVWSKDQTKDETFQNWAKAQIVVMIIMFLIGLILCLTVFLPLMAYIY